MNIISRSWRKVKGCWKQLPIETRGSIAIALPLVCLMGSVIADTVLRQRLIEAQMYVDHTNQVLDKSQGTLISLLNAETGVRGYYIGKQRVFLDPYEKALTTLEPTLISLEQLVQDDPSQVQRVKQLKQIAADRMNLLDSTIRRVETNSTGTPELTMQRLIKGKQAMDKFREVIAEIETEESRLLASRTQSLREQQALNGTVMWYGIAISLLGTAITVRLLRQLAAELRKREVRLLESRSLIEAIVANTADAVMVINARGQVETFNGAAVKMFDYTPAEVTGWPWQKLLTQTADDKTQLTGKIWQTMAQRKNGEWFPIEASLNDIANDDDRIIIIRDITDRQQSAAKLEAKAIELAELNTSLSASNKSLRQSNRELDQFAYITSHDLKAPLRAIGSLSEWIEEDLDGSISTETRSHLNLLRRRVDRMQALLNSLLEYSRAGRKQASIAIVDLEHLLTEVIQALDPPETFTINVASPLPTIETRRQPLQQVLGHLIDNAIRHHPTKAGIIEIAVVDQGDRYEFSIADNGDGIDIQFQARIYTIFQTLKARDQQENVGAGLAIIKKIVTAEGGTIRLESTAGSGATFRFTWPKQAIIKADITPLLNDDANANAKHFTS
jgi:PAS domain S-box-containing protein